MNMIQIYAHAFGVEERELEAAVLLHEKPDLFPQPTDRLALIKARWREAGGGDADKGWLIEQLKIRRAPDPSLALIRDLREPVRWFAGRMETELKKNDDKGGWGKCDLSWLFSRLCEESDELRVVLDAGCKSQTIIAEAADVANFAMMIADRARAMAHLERSGPEAGA